MFELSLQNPTDGKSVNELAQRWKNSPEVFDKVLFNWKNQLEELQQEIKSSRIFFDQLAKFSIEEIQVPPQMPPQESSYISTYSFYLLFSIISLGIIGYFFVDVRDIVKMM